MSLFINRLFLILESSLEIEEVVNPNNADPIVVWFAILIISGMYLFNTFKNKYSES